jgi:hypothetical protein
MTMMNYTPRAQYYLTSQDAEKSYALRSESVSIGAGFGGSQ